MRLIPSPSLAAAASWLLPPTILLFAAGSSSIAALDRIGTRGRWVALLALAAVATAAATRERRATLPAAWLPGLFLVGLAAVSAAWSVDVRQTLGRAASVALLFVAAASLGLAAGPQRVLNAALVGVGAVAAASLVAVLVDRQAAVLSATAGAGWRFRGIGENPNTVAMLLAAGVPLALWAVAHHAGSARAAALLVAVGCAAEIAVSGSRGALVAATAGAIATTTLLARTVRRRALATALVVAVAAACAASTKLQGSPIPETSAASAPSATAPAPQTRGLNAETVFRLEDELGHPPLGGYRPPVERTLIGTSGRAQAWSEAAGQAEERPLVGYGFGTENRVFVDRSYAFEGGFPENTYLGLFLQLGAVGVTTFVVLLVLLGACAARAVRSGVAAAAGPAAAAAGVLVAAAVIGMTQSGLLAVGNIAATTIWASIATLPLLSARGRQA